MITCLLPCKVAHWRYFQFKNLNCGFLKLLRDVVKFQTFYIAENNFKSLQRWTFYCLRLKKLLDEMRLKSTASVSLRNLCWKCNFRANFGDLSLGFDVKASIPQRLPGSPNHFGVLNNLMTLIICESLREISEMACVTSALNKQHGESSASFLIATVFIYKLKLSFQLITKV